MIICIRYLSNCDIFRMWFSRSIKLMNKIIQINLKFFFLQNCFIINWKYFHCRIWQRLMSKSDSVVKHSSFIIKNSFIVLFESFWSSEFNRDVFDSRFASDVRFSSRYIMIKWDKMFKSCKSAISHYIYSEMNFQHALNVWNLKFSTIRHNSIQFELNLQMWRSIAISCSNSCQMWVEFSSNVSKCVQNIILVIYYTMQWYVVWEWKIAL